MATAGVFLLPVFLLLNRCFFRNTKRTFSYLLLALSISAVWVLVGMPNVSYLRFDLELQLIPIIPMLSDFSNTLLNIALFVPLGFLLPVLWKKFRKFSNTLSFCFGASLFIELAQIFTYRATDINDLIANTLGGVLGYLLGRWAAKAFCTAPLGRSQDLIPVFSVTLAVLFFLYPLLAEKLWLMIF
jgi:glycopeptide antibiotics resistance protein